MQDVTAARAVTNSQGQALLEVSTGASQSGDLRFTIAGAGAGASATLERLEPILQK